MYVVDIKTQERSGPGCTTQRPAAADDVDSDTTLDSTFRASYNKAVGSRRPVAASSARHGTWAVASVTSCPGRVTDTVSGSIAAAAPGALDLNAGHVARGD